MESKLPERFPENSQSHANYSKENEETRKLNDRCFRAENFEKFSSLFPEILVRQNISVPFTPKKYQKIQTGNFFY